MISGMSGDAPVSGGRRGRRGGLLTGGCCGGREPKGEDSPDGMSRSRAVPAPTGRERLGVCETSGALHGGVATCTLQGGGEPDRSHSRVHGPPRSQANRRLSRVAEYTSNLPTSCPNNPDHPSGRCA